MTAPISTPPRCRTCQHILTPPGHVCQQCHTVQAVQPAPFQAMAPVSAKSPGLAALFSFLWLGAGHAYVGRIGPAVAFAVVNLFLMILCFSLIGLILAVPVWLVLAPIAMLLAASAAKDHNRRFGLVA